MFYSIWLHRNRLGLLIVLTLFILGTTSNVLAQSSSLEIVPGTVAIDPGIENVLYKALQNADGVFPSEVHYFAVTDITRLDNDNVAFISVAGMINYREHWTLDDDVDWVGLVVMRQTTDQIVAAVEQTAEFSSILSQVSENYLSEESKRSLDRFAVSPRESGSTSPEIPRFPWETYYNMQYGMLGVHSNGFISDWKAVDFLSDGNTSAGHAPNRLLASLSGAIDYVCNDGTNVAIRIDNFFYTHLINNANLVVGKGFAQGDYIGQMKSGSFKDTCGHAEQPTGTFHVHWGFPNLNTLEVAGWVLDTTTQAWTNGTQTKDVYDWIYANRTYCSGPSPLSNQAILFTGLNYCGDYSILELGNYPDASGLGLPDNSITSIRVGNAVTAVIYQDSNYGGIEEEFTTGDFDLRDNTIGNDAISSIIVEKAITVPGKAILSIPNGNITTNIPSYTWNEVSDTTWYYLYVNGPSGNVVKQWYDASVICGGGTCSVTPSTALSAGAHKWWVQTWNSVGYGLWSDEMNFTVPTPPLPGRATLTAPTVSVYTKTPTYTWTAASDTTWYYLWVNGPSGNVFKQWYEASAVCSSGSCSVIPTTALSAGAYKWWIQTWGPGGYGSWSDRMDFTVSMPGKATLTAPTGSITDTTPDYAWNAVEGATWYYLWVNGPSGNVVKQWYDASVICSGGSCSVTSTTVLNTSAHTWWIQTWNPVGYGPWSDGMGFTVSP